MTRLQDLCPPLYVSLPSTLDTKQKPAVKSKSTVNPSTMTIPRSSHTLPIALEVGTSLRMCLSSSVLSVSFTMQPPGERLVSIREDSNGPSDTEVPAWVPFGIGHRRCPAKNFSLLEQRTLAAMLLSKYKWTLPENSIHRKGGIQNAFSAFALSLPYDVEVTFTMLND